MPAKHGQKLVPSKKYVFSRCLKSPRFQKVSCLLAQQKCFLIVFYNLKAQKIWFAISVLKSHLSDCEHCFRFSIIQVLQPAVTEPPYCSLTRSRHYRGCQDNQPIIHRASDRPPPWARSTFHETEQMLRQAANHR